MKSIQRSLVVRLLLCLAVLFAVGSAALYLYARRALVEQFDASLLSRVASLAGMSEGEDREGGWIVEFEFTDFPLPEYQPSPEAEYYQVWDAQGAVLARSPSLGAGDLPRPDLKGLEKGLWDLPLPDGRDGRAAALWFEPWVGKKGDPLLAVAARSRQGLDHTLICLLAGFIAVGLLLLMGIAMIVRWSVGRGLSPLNRIAGETAAIESGRLHVRLPVHGLPEELMPISMGFNELLARIEAAFQRERRFRADIAHELRTPIAELRTLAEVALQQEDPKEAARAVYRDALEIALQMEKLVVVLSALARCEDGGAVVSLDTLDLAGLVRRVMALHQDTAEGRGLSLTVDLPKTVLVRSDKVLLAALVDNLFANAILHAPEKGAVACALRFDDGVHRLTLENTCSHLTPDDVDHLFEPFWQKDPSRTGTHSHGLGLSLAAAYAGLLGLDLKARLPASDRFEIALTIPAP